MIFEKANENDIEALTELRIEFLTEDYGEISADKLSRISANLPPYFRGHLNKDLFVYVCRNKGLIAGCCFLYISEKPSNPSFISGKTGTVLNVYTRPEYRKKGIARELMKMLITESEQMRLDFIELQATDNGYHLYKSLGFEDAVSKYHSMKYVTDHNNADKKQVK